MNWRVLIRSADSMKLGGFGAYVVGVFKAFSVARADGADQSGVIFIRSAAFWRWARYCAMVFPGLKVVRQSWAVSSVGGKGGLPSRWKGRK